MTDWASWQKHVDHVVAQTGFWFGLGDGDGAPLFDLGAPVEREHPDQWMESADISVTFPAVVDGVASRAVEKLVLDGMPGFDESGRLVHVPQEDFTLLIAMRGDGGVVRRGGVVTHATGDDPDNTGGPTSITINALNCMDVWNTIPAVSWPAAWWAATPYERTSDESGLEYSRPWSMARVEMATNRMFTYKHGRAGFVIRRLAQESLDAVMRAQADPDGTRWVDDPFHVVEVPETDNTPEISLEARDGMLWETVAAQARNAGVILGARMWWPGDAPVRCWSPVNSSMGPEEVDISPSEGDSGRTLDYWAFEHAMIVLTVKEVQ